MSISDFTHKDQYDKFSDAIEDGIQGNPYTFAMNDAEYTIQGGAIAEIYNRTNQLGRRGLGTSVGEPLATASNKFGESLFNGTKIGIKATINVTEYMVPSTLVLDSFDGLGKQIDELIEESFTLQAFSLKGTDISCAVFCVLISFLPCSERNRLYEAIKAIEAQSLGLARASDAINEAANTINTSFAMLGDALNGTNELFSLKNKKSGTGIGGAITTVLATPSAIASTIDMFKKAIDLINKAKITVPIDLNGSLWDYAQNALFLLQGMAVQLADQALSTVINPIEEKIKEVQPINCTGNFAAIFFNKILDTVKLFKQWILRLIADLFTESSAFNQNFKASNAHLKKLLEVATFLEALNLMIGRFGDLAIACGVTPCDMSDSPQRHGIPMLPGAGRAAIIPSALENIMADNIEDLAKKIAPILNKPITDIAVSPTEIKTINRINDLPRKLVNSMDALSKELGSDYKIYLNNNDVAVVHSFKRTCGV